jgi:hypothetical protein
MDEFAAFDWVVTTVHEESGDDEWNRPFPPNLGIDDSLQSSDGDCSESDDGEGPNMQQCNYVQLHAVHEHRSAWRCLSGASGGVAGPCLTRLSVAVWVEDCVRISDQDQHINVRGGEGGGGGGGVCYSPAQGHGLPW